MKDTTTVMETSQPTTQTKTPIKLGEFKGSWSRFQMAVYGDLNRAGFAKEVSHKIANDFGSSIGDAMKNADVDKGIKSAVGKAKDDGDSRIKITGSGIVKMSDSMRLIRVVQVIDGLVTEKSLNTREIDQSTLCDKLQDYLTESAKWASEQVWE